jgi:hypothetical protein
VGCVVCGGRGNWVPRGGSLSYALARGWVRAIEVDESDSIGGGVDEEEVDVDA